MFCSKCGAQLNDGSKFCSVCGASLEIPVSQPVAVPAQTPVIGDDSETVFIPNPSQNNETVFASDVAPQNVAVQDTKTVFASAPLPQQGIANNDETVFASDAMPFPQPVPMSQPMQQTPVDVRPTYNSAPAQPAKKKVSTAVVVLVCVLFGLLIFVLGLAAGVAESARSTLDKGLISNEIMEIEVLDMVIGDVLLSDELKGDIEELMADYGRDIGDIDESTTVSEFVIILAESDSVNEKKLKKVLKDTTIMNYLGRVAASYEDYLLEDEDGNVVSVKEIEKLVDKNIDDVEDILDTVFRLDEDELEETLKDNEDMLESFNPQNALDGIGTVSSLALSPVMIISAAALALLLAVLIAVICKNVSVSMLTFGICSVLTGGVMMAVCMLKSVIVDAIGLSYSVVNEVALELLDKTLFGEMMKYGLIIAGVGVFMIIVAVIVKVVTASVRAKAIN